MEESFIKYRFFDDESKISSSDFSKIFEIITNTDKFSEGMLREWFFNQQDVVITSQRVILNSANRLGLEWDQWDNKPTHFNLPENWSCSVPVIENSKSTRPLAIFYITDSSRIFAFKPPTFPWSIDGNTSDKPPGHGGTVHGFFDIAQIIFDGVIDVAYWPKHLDEVEGVWRKGFLSVEFSSLR